MIKRLCPILLMCLSAWLQAQPTITSAIVPSESLQSQERIHVYLPKSYSEGNQSYPVLYVLDGQWFFYNGVAIQETLRGDGLLPEMIVVGVDYKSRAYHDSLHFNHWEALSTYIEEELTAFVDRTYRTSEERIVFGWENPSFMVTELLFQENPVFSGFIASNGGNVEDTMLDNFSVYNGQPLYLFLANSKKDIYTIRSSDELAEKLKMKSFEKLSWRYELFNNETHESLSYTSLYQGLRFYYHNYSSKVFSGTKEFYDEGGLEALEHYFKERSERFGTAPEIDRSTKNSLIWLAWKSDDFPSFKMFMEEFKDVLTTRRYASAYWQNRLGQFYLKYDHADHAVEYFSRGIDQYPDPKYMARMHAGLSDAYTILDNKAKAKTHLKMAIKHAKANSDDQLPEYEKKLKEL